MINLIICVLFFYAAHLFLKMSFSLHKVPFVNFTIANGDLSGMTDFSQRMGIAGENLRQSLFIFIPFAVMSAVLGVDNLMLAKKLYESEHEAVVYKPCDWNGGFEFTDFLVNTVNLYLAQKFRTLRF